MKYKKISNNVKNIFNTFLMLFYTVFYLKCQFRIGRSCLSQFSRSYSLHTRHVAVLHQTQFRGKVRGLSLPKSRPHETG